MTTDVYSALQEPQPLAVDVRGAAQMIGLSPRSIQALIKAGELPSFTVGRRRLLPVEGLRRWIESRTRAAKGGKP